MWSKYDIVAVIPDKMNSITFSSIALTAFQVNGLKLSRKTNQPNTAQLDGKYNAWGTALQSVIRPMLHEKTNVKLSMMMTTGMTSTG